MIDLTKLPAPTLVICGDDDSYLNYNLIGSTLSYLSAGSTVEVIKGGFHVVCLEVPYHLDFQNRLVEYLND